MPSATSAGHNEHIYVGQNMGSASLG